MLKIEQTVLIVLALNVSDRIAEIIMKPFLHETGGVIIR